MRKKKKNVLEKFISNGMYDELVSEYEQEMGEDLYSLQPFICSIYKDINNISPIKFETFMETSLNQSLLTHTPLLGVIEKIKENYMSYDLQTNNTIQHYFKEVNKIYTKNNNNYDIEYCEENREKLLEMNLKSVISEAKKYQGLGVELEDLIAAGNNGLCVAWDKYDPEKAKLKEHMIEAIDEVEGDGVEKTTWMEVLDKYFKYGKIKRKFEEGFHGKDTIKKEEVRKWVEKNVKNAKFNSVATMWIKAYIYIELNNNSRLVKKPKVEIVRDKEKDGFYSKEKLLCIDSPVSSDSDTPLGDILQLDAEENNGYEVEEAYKTYKHLLGILMTDVKSRDRGIVMKKFGIGLPRPMQPDEISEQENLSVARISQILQDTLLKMQENAIKYKVSKTEMYQALELIQ